MNTFQIYKGPEGLFTSNTVYFKHWIFKNYGQTVFKVVVKYFQSQQSRFLPKWHESSYNTELNISLQIPASCPSCRFQGSMQNKFHFPQIIPTLRTRGKPSHGPLRTFLLSSLGHSANIHQFLISVRPCDGSQVNKSGYEWCSPCSQRGACILVAKTDIKDVDSQVVRFNSCYNLHYLNKEIET